MNGTQPGKRSARRQFISRILVVCIIPLLLFAVGLLSWISAFFLYDRNLIISSILVAVGGLSFAALTDWILHWW